MGGEEEGKRSGGEESVRNGERQGEVGKGDGELELEQEGETIYYTETI